MYHPKPQSDIIKNLKAMYRSSLKHTTVGKKRSHSHYSQNSQPKKSKINNFFAGDSYERFNQKRSKIRANKSEKRFVSEYHSHQNYSPKNWKVQHKEIVNDMQKKYQKESGQKSNVSLNIYSRYQQNRHKREGLRQEQMRKNEKMNLIKKQIMKTREYAKKTAQAKNLNHMLGQVFKKSQTGINQKNRIKENSSHFQHQKPKKSQTSQFQNYIRSIGKLKDVEEKSNKQKRNVSMEPKQRSEYFVSSYMKQKYEKRLQKQKQKRPLSLEYDRSKRTKIQTKFSEFLKQKSQNSERVKETRVYQQNIKQKISKEIRRMGYTKPAQNDKEISQQQHINKAMEITKRFYQFQQKEISQSDKDSRGRAKKSGQKEERHYDKLQKRLTQIEKKLQELKQNSSLKPTSKHSPRQNIAKPSYKKEPTTTTKPDQNQYITQVKPKYIKQVKPTSLQRKEVQLPDEKAWLEQTFFYYQINLQQNQFQIGRPLQQEFDGQLMQIVQFMKLAKCVTHPTRMEVQKKKVNLPILAKYKNCKTLIFDLDETLIHCQQDASQRTDVELPITFPNGVKMKVIYKIQKYDFSQAGINVRPYARETLKELSKFFEIIIFTASHSCYANVVLDYLDPKNKYISYRLFRESCCQTKEGVYVKNLSIFENRKLENLIIIDNAAYSFAFQINNGIPIVPYYEGQNDLELKAMIPYLKSLQKAKDVRSYNKHYLKLEEYFGVTNVEQLKQRLSS